MKFSKILMILIAAVIVGGVIYVLQSDPSIPQNEVVKPISLEESAQ